MLRLLLRSITRESILTRFRHDYLFGVTHRLRVIFRPRPRSFQGRCGMNIERTDGQITSEIAAAHVSAWRQLADEESGDLEVSRWTFIRRVGLHNESDEFACRRTSTRGAVRTAVYGQHYASIRLVLLPSCPSVSLGPGRLMMFTNPCASYELLSCLKEVVDIFHAEVAQLSFGSIGRIREQHVISAVG